jgi:hypothetical protein
MEHIEIKLDKADIVKYKLNEFRVRMDSGRKSKVVILLSVIKAREFSELAKMVFINGRCSQMKRTFLTVLMLTVLVTNAHAQMPGMCSCYGGMDEEGGWWYLLDYFGHPLEDGNWVYAAWAGPDEEIDPVNVHGYPTGDDLLIRYQTGDYLEYATFWIAVTTFPPGDPADRRPQCGDRIYCRMFDGPEGNIRPHNYYGNSQIYEVKYWPMEEFFCLFPGDPGGGHTDTPVHEGEYKGLTIYGGLDTTDMSYWPLTDAEGRQLEDGDLVQLLWTGPDGLIDPLNEVNGQPTGDDHVLVEWGIGHGVDGVGTGRFEFELCTLEAEPPGQGDAIYLRIFNDSRFARADYYGESGVHIIAYELGEVYFSFVDGTEDAVIANPCFTFREPQDRSEVSLPAEYALHQNCPNPFNASTSIRYQIPQAAGVSLKVFNVLGQEVITLVNERQLAGEYNVTWEGRDDGGRAAASGIYFCRLQAGAYAQTVKMVLLR